MFIFIDLRMRLKDSKFQEDSVSDQWEGKTHTYTFQYRDPWKWVCDLVTDPLLAPMITWYPTRKYLHQDGKITQLIDEPWTASDWWDAQVSIFPDLASFDSEFHELGSTSLCRGSESLSSAAYSMARQRQCYSEGENASNNPSSSLFA